MLVKDLMTTPAISIAPEAPIAEALSLMIANRIGGLPVTDAGGFVRGLLTEDTFLRRAELDTAPEAVHGWLNVFALPRGDANAYINSHGRTVGEIMTPDVPCVSPDTSLPEVAALMTRTSLRCLPVAVDGKLCGVITRADFVRALADTLAKPSNGVVEDRVLEFAVQAELDRFGWNRKQRIHASVSNGQVTLSGTVYDDRVRLAAKVAAEYVPGVKAVQDDTVWIDPLSGMPVLTVEDRLAARVSVAS